MRTQECFHCNKLNCNIFLLSLDQIRIVLTKFPQFYLCLSETHLILHAALVVSEVVLLGVLDDDGALDIVPVSRLHDADHGRIFGDFLSVELPSELFDLRDGLRLTVDVDSVPHRAVLSHVGAEDDGGGQERHLQHGVIVEKMTGVVGGVVE